MSTWRNVPRNKTPLGEAYPDITWVNPGSKRVYAPDTIKWGTTRPIKNGKQKRANKKGISYTGGFVAPPISGGVVTRPIVPRFTMRGDSTIVHNSELVTSLTLPALGAFFTGSFPLIPTFPTWLANVADLYSKFRWVFCHVVYIPKCPTTTSGAVVMAFNYDRNDALPAGRQQLSQTHKAINFPPYAGFDGASFMNGGGKGDSAIYLTLDTSKLDKPWYPTMSLATFTALAVIDQNQFCPASLVYGLDSGPAVATPAGDLFMRYAIEFIEPINPGMNV